jgi:transposase
MAPAEALPERLGCLPLQKSYFAAYFQRIAAHRGSKRAIVAVSHALLVVCYYLLKRKCHFQDLGVNYFDQLNHERLTKYFVNV